MKKTSDHQDKLSVSFMSGVGMVTGANFLLNVPSSGKSGKSFKLLIDCGMVQGSSNAEALNRVPFSYNPQEIDCLIITHAHLDHVGRIPKLVKDGFSGIIYSTPATRDLAELILDDAVHLQKQSAERQNLAPLYEPGDVEHTMSLWKTHEYHEDFELAPGINIYFRDAGHILGSSIVEVTITDASNMGEQKKITFTGDLGNTPTPLLRDTEDISTDYLIMESVYGDRNHEAHDVRVRELERIIKETHAKHGTLVIPAFSIERTQVILYEIDTLLEAGKIPSMPVFLDSPLATKVTEVYKTYISLLNPETQAHFDKHGHLFNFPKLTITASVRDSQDIMRTAGPKIVVAGSGMSMGGRVRRHEAEYAPDPKNTILLVGYQPVGTLGRRLQDRTRFIEIDGSKIEVKAKIETIFGYSAHKDSDHLVEFVSHSKKTLRKVFVVMGEPSSAAHLAQRLNHELDVDAVCPLPSKPYFL